MKTTRVVALTVALAAVAACSTKPWEPAALPPADSAVTALLPTGTYTFTGGLTIDSGPVTQADGFVDFGTAADGADCESDYTLTDVKADSSTSVQKVRGVRTAGRPSFYQDLTDESKPGEWMDIADPQTGGIILLFVPAIITSDFSHGPADNAGNGNLCSIGVMPRFMSVENGTLIFDAERTATVVEATRGNWTASYLDALGLKGRKRNKIAEELNAITIPTFDTLTRDTVVEISKNADGGFTLTQTKEDKPIVELVFTPAPDRTVAPIDAPTYFERVAKDARRDGLDKVLADLGV
jgi:hypothetical protein